MIAGMLKYISKGTVDAPKHTYRAKASKKSPQSRRSGRETSSDLQDLETER